VLRIYRAKNERDESIVKKFRRWYYLCISPRMKDKASRDRWIRIRNSSAIRPGDTYRPERLFFSFFFICITLCAREGFAPVLRHRVRFSVFRIDCASSATLGREEASETHRRSTGTTKKYKFYLSSFFAEYRIHTQFASRECDYYVRMRDSRSCRIVCILLVARNRFMILRG